MKVRKILFRNIGKLLKEIFWKICKTFEGIFVEIFRKLRVNYEKYFVKVIDGFKWNIEKIRTNGYLIKFKEKFEKLMIKF